MIFLPLQTKSAYRVRVVLSCFLLIALSRAGPEAQPSPLVIESVTIVDVVEGRHVANQTVAGICE